jgi:glycerophosphoryl diester phosphodiesterase
MAQIPQLVAHRGFPHKYPENTLIGLEAALQVGACFVEFDVQMTSDHVPVVIHDADPFRCSGQSGSVLESPIAIVDKISVGEPTRFGDQFVDQNIPRLEQVVELLMQWPSRIAFVEIKRSSLRHFGIKTVVNQVQQVLAPIAKQTVLISYDHQALEMARQSGTSSIGWVFEEWGKAEKHIAEQLHPDFLITDYQCVPKGQEELWQGPWRWMVYEIDDANIALSWGSRAAFVETNAIGMLLQNIELGNRGCKIK